MGKIIETTIDNFGRGITNAVRSKNTRLARSIQNFDILSAEGKLIPNFDSEADGSTGDTEQLCLFLTLGTTQANTKQYALGIQGSGSSRPKVFERASIPTGAWSGSTSGIVTTGGARSEKVFVAYNDATNDLIFGLSTTNGIWEYNVTGASITDQRVSLTFTDSAQGLVHSKSDILYIPYDNKIASKNGAAAFNTTALTLPRHTVITRIAEWGNYLVITTRPKYIGGKSTIYLWDQDSTLTTLSEKIDWGNEDIEFIEEVDGYLVGISKTSATSVVKKPKILFKYALGSGTKKFLEFDATNVTILFGNNIQKQNSRLYFLMSVEIDSTRQMGLWSIGRNAEGEFSLFMDRMLDNGTTTFTASDAPLGFQLLGDYLTVAYKVGSTYTIRRTDDDGYTATSFYESLIFNAGDGSLKKDLKGITVMHQPLPTVGQVVVKYKKDAESSFTTILTSSTDNTISESAVNIQSSGTPLPKGYKEIQFRMESTGNAIITGLSFQEDVVGGRIYQAIWEFIKSFI